MSGWDGVTEAVGDGVTEAVGDGANDEVGDGGVAVSRLLMITEDRAENVLVGVMCSVLIS